MTPVMQDEFRAALARGSVREADPRLGIGRELSFVDAPPRRIVVHVAEDEPTQYMREVMDRILALEDSWLLVPRRTTVASLRILPAEIDAAAVRFDAGERASLSEYLCTRDVGLAAASADLYALSVSGRVLITWDHHTADEGLDVQLRDVAQASTLLGALNELGTELELLYVDLP